MSGRLAISDDVGLLSEQYGVENGVLAGNFPQAFSHFAMIDTAFNFARVGGSACQRNAG